MNDVIHKLCDDIRELGTSFETEPSNGNPIQGAVNRSGLFENHTTRSK